MTILYLMQKNKIIYFLSKFEFVALLDLSKHASKQLAKFD